jgi:hypothetical protein
MINYLILWRYNHLYPSQSTLNVTNNNPSLRHTFCYFNQVTAYIGDCALPFVVLRNEVKLRPRSFVKVAIRFVPVSGRKPSTRIWFFIELLKLNFIYWILYTPFRSKRVSLPASSTDLERQAPHRGFLIRFLPLDVTGVTVHGPWGAMSIFCYASHLDLLYTLCFILYTVCYNWCCNGRGAVPFLELFFQEPSQVFCPAYLVHTRGLDRTSRSPSTFI